MMYGEWLPDQADYQNPGLIDCRNVIPMSDGYRPLNSKNATGETVTGTVIGSRRFERADGTVVIVVGTTSDLYTIVDNTVTASSLSLSATAANPWSFEQFGAAVYATSRAGGSYYLTDIESDLTFSTSPGTPPDGNSLARIGDFLFYGNLVDNPTGGGSERYRVRWSAFNNPQLTWGTDIATQMGFQDMPTRYGEVTGVAGGETGLIFQKYAVHSARPVSGQAPFTFDEIDVERGCVAPQSIVRVGNFTFWVAHDGFCRSEGVNVEVLSPAKIWDWFRETSQMSSISRVQGAADFSNRCVFWAFYSSENEQYTHLLIYQWELNRWSYAVMDVEWLVETILDGTTLEEFAVDYPNLDLAQVSMDSTIFRNLGRSFAVFDNSELHDLNGDAMEARFETGDFQILPGARAFISEVTPLIENVSGNSQAVIGTREKPGGPVTYTDAVEENDFGICPVVADGRYIRIRHIIPAGSTWDKCQGFLSDAVASGKT